MGWHINNRHSVSIFLEAGKSKIKVPTYWCLVKTCFLVNRCVFPWRKSEGALWRSLLIMALILFIKAPHLCPNPLPKPSPPNTITLEVRFQYMNFEETQAFNL